MSVPDARRLKQLEEENARLKKLLAEAHAKRMVSASDGHVRSLAPTAARSAITIGDRMMWRRGSG